MNREEKIRKLKEKIENHLENSGSLYDSKKDIPYYSYMVDLIKKDKYMGVTSTVESLYKECGYEYTSRKKEISLERIKKEIDEYVSNGGDIYDKKEDLPYYDLIGSFIRKYPNSGWSYKKIYEACGYEYNEKMEEVTIERLKRVIDKYVADGGDIYEDRDSKPYYALMCNLVAKYKRVGVNYTLEDIMRLCGYEYLNQKRNNYRLMKIFDNIKDEDGYIDDLKNTADGKRVFYSIQERAKNKKLSVNEYLMATFGVRFSNTYSDVDYIGLVERDLIEYENKYGYENVNHKHIGLCDTRLLYRIEHLSRYFPCGSVTPSEVLMFFGYDSEAKDKKVIDEEKVVDSLYKLFPNRDVSGLTRIKSLYDKVVKLSAQYDMTIEQYLKNRGFSKKNNKTVYRLSRAKQDNDDNLYREICLLRKDLIRSSLVFNNPNSTQLDISNEIDVIAEKVVKSIIKKKNSSKR